MKQYLPFGSNYLVLIGVLCFQFGLQHTTGEVLVHSATCKLVETGFDVATDNDFQTEIADEPTHCCAICEKTNGCRAWAWNFIGPTCYLKNATHILKAKDTTTRAGIMGDLATCIVHKGFDIASGNDLSWQMAESPGDCCGICAGIPECKAWTHNVSPPRCYLKTNTTLVPASDDTTVAGILADSSDNDLDDSSVENETEKSSS